MELMLVGEGVEYASLMKPIRGVPVDERRPLKNINGQDCEYSPKHPKGTPTADQGREKNAHTHCSSSLPLLPSLYMFGKDDGEHFPHTGRRQ
jgi:hypothetical protein